MLVVMRQVLVAPGPLERIKKAITDTFQKLKVWIFLRSVVW